MPLYDYEDEVRHPDNVPPPHDTQTSQKRVGRSRRGLLLVGIVLIAGGTWFAFSGGF